MKQKSNLKVKMDLKSDKVDKSTSDQELSTDEEPVSPSTSSNVMENISEPSSSTVKTGSRYRPKKPYVGKRKGLKRKVANAPKKVKSSSQPGIENASNSSESIGYQVTVTTIVDSVDAPATATVAPTSAESEEVERMIEKPPCEEVADSDSERPSLSLPEFMKVLGMRVIKRDAQPPEDKSAAVAGPSSGVFAFLDDLVEASREQGDKRPEVSKSVEIPGPSSALKYCKISMPTPIRKPEGAVRTKAYEDDAEYKFHGGHVYGGLRKSERIEKQGKKVNYNESSKIRSRPPSVQMKEERKKQGKSEDRDKQNSTATSTVVSAPSEAPMSSKQVPKKKRVTFAARDEVFGDSSRHDCNQCKAHFALEDYLEFHMVKMHSAPDPNNKFPKCAICMEVVFDDAELDDHFAKAHGG